MEFKKNRRAADSLVVSGSGVLILVFGCLIMLGAALIRTPSPNSAPWAFITEEGSRPKTSGSLDLAIWDDGVFIYLKYPSESKMLSKSYAIGKLTDTETKKLKADVDQEGLVKIKHRIYSIPASSTFRIGLRNENSLLCSSLWDERIVRDWGSNTRGDKDYRDFAKSWISTRICLATVSREDAKLTAEFHQEGSFRGFDPKKGLSMIPWFTEMVTREANEAEQLKNK